MTTDNIIISKTMSYILRHRAIDLGINMDSYGRILLSDLLSNYKMKKLKATEEIVRNIVNINDKKRFTIENVDGKVMIKANQGHSKKFENIIDENKLLTEITEPVICIHGTFYDVYNIIKKGLKPMSRTHIHFATGYPNDKNIISGARKNSEIFIEIDMNMAMKDGIKFFKSDNNVILTKEIILPKYFLKVIANDGKKLKFNNSF